MMTNRRTDYAYIAGWIAIALSGLLVAPQLSLRQAIPSSVLLGALLLARRCPDLNRFRIVGAYALFWMLSGVVAARSGALHVQATALAFAGMVLFVPSTLRGVRASKAHPQRMDIGVAGAVAAVTAIHAVAGFGPHPPDVETSASLVFLLAGGMFIWFSGRGTPLAVDHRRVHTLFCSLFFVVTLVSFASPFRLLVSCATARMHTARNDLASAVQQEQTCERLAIQLEARSALISTLRRQAALAGSMTNDALQRTKLLALTQHCEDPSAWQWLLHDGLRESASQSALNAFMHLANDRITPEEALAMVPFIAGQMHAHRPAFLKLWQILGEDLPQGDLPPEILLDWGRKGYFDGDRDFASFCLKRGLQTKAPPWDAVRILWQLTMDSGDLDEAEAIRSRYAPPESHVAESIYWGSEIARRRGQDSATPEASRDVRTRGCFGGALQLLDASITPPSVRRGDSATLRFVWKTVAPVNPDWKVFVHLRQQRYGGFFFQHDYRFVDVGCPPRQWALGATFIYDLSIRVPDKCPPGTYAILTGIWDGQQRLRIRDPHIEGQRHAVTDDQIELGTLGVSGRKPTRNAPRAEPRL